MAIENNQYEILGAHLGGVHEALWTTKEGSKRTSRSLKYVVSPHDRGGSILAGGAAERSRVGLGLPWPPEAQIINCVTGGTMIFCRASQIQRRSDACEFFKKCSVD